MRYIVLYADRCSACSKAARVVRSAAVAGLEARAFEDPQVSELLGQAGLQIPDRPSLLIIDTEDIQIISGWAMRRRLASVVGWRRSGTIVRLLAAEWRARLATSDKWRAPSRRGVIGGAIAGIAGWALTSGPARASTMPSTGEQAMKPADPATFERLMKTASAQRAVRTWGPAEQEVLEVSSGSQPVLVLTHPGKDVFTFIDNSPGAMRNGNPTALSMGAAPTAKHALRYYTVDGVPLADVAESGGRVTASPVPVHAVEAVPELKKWQITCFALCVGKKSETAGCIMTCQGCVFDATGTLAKVIACTHCVVCAGPSGVACLKECSAL